MIREQLRRFIFENDITLDTLYQFIALPDLLKCNWESGESEEAFMYKHLVIVCILELIVELEQKKKENGRRQ